MLFPWPSTKRLGNAGVADAAGGAYLIKIFENLDGQISPDAGAGVERHGGEGALRRRCGQIAGDTGKVRHGLRQKKAVVGDFGDTAEARRAVQKALDRLGV